MSDSLPARALVVSTIAAGNETPARMGSVSYSYYWVAQAFAPLLQRWGTVMETVRPGRRLETLLQRARDERAAVVHLGFLPLDHFHPAPGVPNAAFPFWDFPDLPADSLGGNPNNNWTRIANGLDLILTSNSFTRDAFVRAGVQTPIHIVPVPVREEYFAVPLRGAGERTVIDCSCYRVPPARPVARVNPPRGRLFYHEHVRPHLSRRVAGALSFAAHAVADGRRDWRDSGAVDCPVSRPLELAGIVYTTIVNPFDQRKNWPDLLTAYLLALRDCDDATLVMKLAVPPDRAPSGVNTVLRFYRSLGLEHRCNLVLVSDYLSDEQMVELARGSTYYLNASRAEGACLPMQNFLAAGRPAIAPRHTAMAEYFADDSGFVVESHPEPASWPQDADGRCTTTWHRLVWTSLRDQIQESHRIARSHRAEYDALSAAARARMTALAGAEPVWTRLAAALDSVANGHAL